MAGHIARRAICKGLGIEHTRIYKDVANVTSDGVITTKEVNGIEGKKYKLILTEIKDE